LLWGSTLLTPVSSMHCFLLRASRFWNMEKIMASPMPKFHQFSK
jgi:ABC-type multidrug transport system permease subunit